MYNPNFKVFESEHFKKDVGLVTFIPSVSEWVGKSSWKRNKSRVDYDAESGIDAEDHYKNKKEEHDNV